jgi:hypothetical protein
VPGAVDALVASALACARHRRSARRWPGTAWPLRWRLRRDTGSAVALPLCMAGFAEYNLGMQRSETGEARDSVSRTIARQLARGWRDDCGVAPFANPAAAAALAGADDGAGAGGKAGATASAGASEECRNSSLGCICCRDSFSQIPPLILPLQQMWPPLTRPRPTDNVTPATIASVAIAAPLPRHSPALALQTRRASFSSAGPADASCVRLRLI